MASDTAIMLVGSGHPNHGGIGARHMLWLNENSRPAWTLTRMSQSRRSPLDSPRGQPTVWIPSEDMLEDGLLMVGLLICRDPRLMELANTYFKNDFKKRIEMYDDISPEHRRSPRRSTLK